MPYYICTEAANQCVKRCSDSICQSACRGDHPCGAQKPERVNVTTTSAPPATSTTMANIKATKVPTGAASLVIPLDQGYIYGSCMLVGGMVAGFAGFL